jgi:hypothetical protein
MKYAEKTSRAARRAEHKNDKRRNRGVNKKGERCV